jgi:ABC-type proline/glycine betaine transport system permease subunit
VTAHDPVQGLAGNPAITAVGGATSGRKRALLRDNADLFVYPVIVVVGLAIAFVSVFSQPLDFIETQALEPATVVSKIGTHLALTAASTIAVLVIAVPVGILVSRRRARRAQGTVLALGGFAQALPPFGLIVLLAFLIDFGFWTAVLALTLAALLPVLRNTVVGLQQVDRSLIEAARGMGMSSRQTLFRVEIPLAVPVIIAGMRVALVLNIGTATLATYIGAGGLGDIIVQSLTSNRFPVLVIGGTLVAALALIVDWLAGIVERVVVARSG